MKHFWRTLLLSLTLTITAALHLTPAAQAQTGEIEISPAISTDEAITERLNGIFGQISELESVEVNVSDGVVTLSGNVATDSAADRATDLASRTAGVVTVEDQLERSREIAKNVSPVLESAQATLINYYHALPLFGLALIVFLIIAFVGHLFASWSRFWQRILPNPFLAELVSQAVRIIMLGVGLVVALNLTGSTALIGAILGGAGVLGIAIGFAVRDSLENYISSIMLSIRQPFRANEHVVIDNYEGKVVRLTSRATVLMTLDGNHLRIPNSSVFKAVILNYTRNPERRFEFELGVDAEDDPLSALSTGIETLQSLDFILKEPNPKGIIKKVGDSNIVLTFFAWVDQTQSDFGKARGVAIAHTKAALEVGGFSLPEPIYRLRVDGLKYMSIVESAASDQPPAKPEAPKPASPPSLQATSVAPDTDLDEIISEERADESTKDLLDDDRPVE